MVLDLGGLGFEEYLVFRSFATASCLEEQYRFLWRLFDRDGDDRCALPA